MKDQPNESLSVEERRLTLERERLTAEIQSIKDELAFLKAAMSCEATRKGEYGTSPNERSEYLRSLWKGCDHPNEKIQACSQAAEKLRPKLAPLEKELGKIAEALEQIRQALAERTGRELALCGGKAWQADIVRLAGEITETRSLQSEQSALTRQIHVAEDLLQLLADGRRSILGKALMMIESVILDRLLFGAFSLEEKLARIDLKVAETERDAARWRKRLAENERRLSELRSQLARQFGPEFQDRNERVDVLMLQAEELSASIDALAGIARELSLPLPQAARGYECFRLPWYRGNSEFRRERLAKLNAGLLKESVPA